MSDTKNIDAYRRKFLVVAGVTAAVTIAPGLILRQAQAKNADEAVTNKIRWGMLIDVDKLPNDGQDLVDTCKETHGWGNEAHSNEKQKTHWVRTVTVTEKTTRKVTKIPVMCQHCETAPCADVCPTGASFKRADGIVLVNKHICIGCRYCMMACPYKARSLVHEAIFDKKPDMPRGKGTVEACTMCAHLIDVGKEPACVEGSNGAIVFGNLYYVQ